MSEPVSLDGLMRSVLEESASTDPEVLAKEIVAAAPAASMADLFTEAVRLLIPRAASNGRRAATKGEAARSAKWEAAASSYQRLLGSRLATESGLKRLADCTRDDLLAAAAGRRDLAAEVIVWAERYERLADSMRRRRAKVVADLPEKAVMEVFS